MIGNIERGSLFVRLLASAITVIFMMSLLWMLTQLYFLKRNTDAVNTMVLANRVMKDVFETRMHEKNFLLRSIHDKEFYTAGSTIELASYKDAFKGLQSDIEELRTEANSKYEKIIQEIKDSTIQYNSYFTDIIQQYNILGYGEYGLSGDLRGHRAEMVELLAKNSSVELNRAVNRLLLVVIDYLVDDEMSKVSMVENSIDEVRALAKESDASFTDELLTVLDNYEAHFLQHAAIRDKIGWSEELGLTAQMRSVVKSIEPKLLSLLDSTLEDRQSTLSRLKFASFGVIAIGFILGITMFSLFSKQITRPVQFVTAVVERLSLGDVQQDVEMISGPSEIQKMLRHFQRMIDSLRERSSLAERISEGRLDIEVPQVHEADVLGRALQKMLEKLKGQVGELKSGVNVLGSSTSEITSTVAQVASSSMETATAVTQTMATAEELRQTSELNAQKAKHVSESANQTSSMSMEGQKSTAQILSTMENIRSQMEAIAESVISLSEQSKTIGEIISAVDDLAEQSNILSVNAAIEAARAGEQGRGFAIVAQEIRSLAEQSKDATKRVRIILADIQKATSNTVMATEQGSKAVERGALQADAVNGTIQSLADKIATVDQAAIQIMSSSKQQLVGVEQVAAAIQNIRDATTQNAKSMEQLEKAAGSLEEMGHVIVNQINWYKI